MVFLQPVLQAVCAVAARAVNAWITPGCARERFACWAGAGPRCVDGEGRAATRACRRGCAGGGATPRPVSGFRTFVCGFGSVVEAKCAEAGFAAEWEEVELVAVWVLAVGADEGWV